MDRVLLEALIEKTVAGKVTWKHVSESYGNKFNYQCELETGYFWLEFIPNYPIDMTKYILSWCTRKFPSDSFTVIANETNFESADGKTMSDFVKRLYEIVHNKLNSKETTKPDMSSAMEALGLAT